jgi:hypothetical protein
MLEILLNAAIDCADVHAGRATQVIFTRSRKL